MLKQYASLKAGILLGNTFLVHKIFRRMLPRLAILVALGLTFVISMVALVCLVLYFFYLYLLSSGVDIIAARAVIVITALLLELLLFLSIRISYSRLIDMGNGPILNIVNAFLRGFHSES